MTTRQRFLRITEAILETLCEVEEHPAPKGPIYMALECDIDLVLAVEQHLVNKGFVVATRDTLDITLAGREVTAQLAALRLAHGGSPVSCPV